MKDWYTLLKGGEGGGGTPELCVSQKCVKARSHPPWLRISSAISPGVLGTPLLWQEISSTKDTQAFGPRLDGRAIRREFHIILHLHSILHHGHHPCWLGISIAITTRRGPVRTCSKQTTELYYCTYIFFFFQYLILGV